RALFLIYTRCTAKWFGRALSLLKAAGVAEVGWAYSPAVQQPQPPSAASAALGLVHDLVIGLDHVLLSSRLRAGRLGARTRGGALGSGLSGARRLRRLVQRRSSRRVCGVQFVQRLP